MVKASKLINWVIAQLGLAYVYATVGQVCTIPLLMKIQKQYGATMGEGYYQLKGDYTKGRCGKWLGKVAYDCSGLIKAGRKALSGIWRDVSAQGTYDQCIRRGPIKDMPLIPGCAVFMYSASKKRMGHVGLYIGNGFVVEARGVDYGVVKTKLSSRAWGYWGLLDWLEYDIKSEGGKALVGNQNDAGDATNPKPDDKLNFIECLEFIDSKIDIDLIYWKAKLNIDPYFDDLLLKIATAWKNDKGG